ncbi:MAG: SRPBCC family protein [Gemmatimonadota bacterium]|nr:SRPBCC family protein [Gemmatimonadota bacterium]MDH3422333.1 SRPBCC family protein [Gemmatimonadota bacterium]
MEAALERDGPRYTLVVERRLDHPPEKVWRVVTEPELLQQWFPAAVEGGWSVGAALRFVFLHGEGEGLSEEELRGEVLAVDEPRLLEFRWGAHVLKFELEPDGSGCRFRLSETIEDPSWGARNAAGWEMCLDNLDLVLEGGAILKFAVEVWRAKFRHYVKKFEATYGPQDDPTADHPLLTEDGDG